MFIKNKNYTNLDPMWNLLFLILFSLCDNIEIATKDFDSIHLGDKTLYSSLIKDANSVKISFLGSSIYFLDEVSPRIFVLKDKTTYFGRGSPAKLRIDFESKFIGVEYFVYRFIFYNIKVLLTSIALMTLIFKKHRIFAKFYEI